MTEEKINLFVKDFLFLTGISLEKRLRSGDNESGKLEAFVNRVEMIIEEEIKTRNPNYTRQLNHGLITELQKEAIYKAMLEQATYIFSVGDMTMISGYDPVTGIMTPLNEIRKRTLSPMAKKILTNAGLFYSGIGQRTQGGYQEQRSGWR